MNITAVVFDYGGVISFLPPPEKIHDLEHLTGLSAGILRDLNRKYRGEWDRGSCSGKEYYHRILAVEGIFPDDETLLRIAETDMQGWVHIDPETIRLMKDIKAAGFRLGILSNMPFDFLDWVRENIPVYNTLDAAVFSSEEAIIKPEPGIYEALRERLNCTFQEIVFFDDLMDNVTKARELGISGFHWDGPEEARKILKGLGGGFTVL